MKKEKLSFLQVAFLYIGAIMGAGFASGREIWQFFGVFGKYGYIGIALVAVLFTATGYMASRLVVLLQTEQMGAIVMPIESHFLKKAISTIMTIFLFMPLVNMSAAGGALVAQQFGLSSVFGGSLVVCFVISTVIGGFERVSRVFRFLMPVLLLVVLAVSILMIVKGDGFSMPEPGVFQPSPLAPNWSFAAVLYFSGCFFAIIPIIAAASMNAQSKNHAYFGAAFGGLLLGIIAFVLLCAVMTDSAFSNQMALPMLAFSGKISREMNLIYTCILFFAIYASAASNFYGFTMRVVKPPHKTLKIVVFAWLGFAIGLVGFTRLVAYLFPAAGFIGFVIFVLFVVNYTKVVKRNKKRSKTLFQEFENHNRFDFPEGITRVTAGNGGEALLVTGSEKTALIDCGMAYCAEELIQNVKEAISGRPLDYIFLSHTHYDHIGALPFLRQEWPEAVVLGAAHAKKIFERPGAIHVIRSLSETAGKQYQPDHVFHMPDGGFAIDRVLSDGEMVSLGDEKIVTLETKGHTDCSLTFVLEPRGIMFLSESTGVLASSEKMHVTILKNYRDTMDAQERCQSYGAKRLISPHYGMVPEYFNDQYWNLFMARSQEMKDLLLDLFQKGASEEEILNAYVEYDWVPQREGVQPKEAFLLNAVNIIKVFRQEFELGNYYLEHQK